MEKGTLDKGACLGRVWRRARLTKGVPGKVLKKGTLDKGRAWEGFGEKGTARMEKGALGKGLGKGTARHAWKRARLGRVWRRARHGTHGKGRTWGGFWEGHAGKKHD